MINDDERKKTIRGYVISLNDRVTKDITRLNDRLIELSVKERPLLSALARLFLIVANVCIILGVCVCLYYMFWPIKVFEMTKIPINVLNTNHKVEAGGVLYYQIEFKKYRDVAPILTRKLVNSVTINDSTHMLRGSATVGEGKLVNSFNIPKDAWPGKYRMIWTADYNINFLRKITKQYESEYFDIVPANSLSKRDNNTMHEH